MNMSVDAPRERQPVGAIEHFAGVLRRDVRGESREPAVLASDVERLDIGAIGAHHAHVLDDQVERLIQGDLRPTGAARGRAAWASALLHERQRRHGTSGGFRQSQWSGYEKELVDLVARQLLEVDVLDQVHAQVA